MSRFADLSQQVRKTIGPCQCTGTPHPEGDWAMLHTQLGYSALGQIGTASALSMGDFTAARRKLIELDVASWNLLGPKGEEWPPTDETIALLDEATIEVLAGLCNEALRKTEPLGNASGAPSVDGSPGSASPTPGTPTPPTSTTS